MGRGEVGVHRKGRARYCLGAGERPSSASRTRRMYSGVVPQQPPKMVAPASRQARRARAKSSGSMWYRPSTGSGRPALGLAITGRRVFSHSSCTRGRRRSGPREQFRPMASAPNPSRVRAMEGMVQPVKVRPEASKDMVTKAGRPAASFTASRAALASYRSVMVSITARSAPARAPASAASRKRAQASSKDRLPMGSSSSPRGPRSRATRAPDSSAASRAFRTAAATTCSTLWPEPASLRALAPKVLV